MTTTETPMARSPSSRILRSPLPPEAPKESALSRLLIAPLTFVSFLVSLAIVDSRNHRLRTHEHSSSPHPPPAGVYGSVKYYIHTMIFKPVPTSPYAYIKSPNQLVEGETNGKKESVEQWHWHTKQRHMMKAELDDAFRVRKWVVVILVLTGGIWVLMLGIMWRWMNYLLGF